MSLTLNTVSTSLGGRMKKYEEKEVILDSHLPIVVRIDGHHFSKFTRGFKKPFDPILSSVMESTTKDVVKRFNAVVGYTQSDEITIVMPSLWEDTDKRRNWRHMFNGRMQKLVSLVAGFTTTRFNYHLQQSSNGYLSISSTECIRYRETLKNKSSGIAFFDARAFNVPNATELFHCVMWRVQDALKNSKSVFAQAYCPHKSLHKKSGDEQVAFCLETTGNDWNTLDDRFKYGILVKKTIVYVPTTGPRKIDGKVVDAADFTTLDDQLPEFAKRTRLVGFSKQLTSYSEENVDLINSQYY